MKLEKGESKLEKLTVQSAAGTKTGDTKLTVTPNKTGNNTYKYKLSEEEVAVAYGQNVKTWSVYGYR